MLSKFNYFNLINAANIDSGLMRENCIGNRKHFDEFEILANGLPIPVVADDVLFDFKKSSIFELSALDICNKVYNHNDISYIGFKHAYSKLSFVSEYKIKECFHAQLEEVIQQNLTCIQKIKALGKTYKILGAFQTRNIPHYGHEEIIRTMLKTCDHVVINPVVGPKKAGDITLLALKKAFEYLSINKFDKKISFLPIIANMFYAGPNEAIHHTILRQRLGFDVFTVGRDHAGAQGKYGNAAAHELIKKNINLFGIQVICHGGAAYCTNCKKVSLIGDCQCDGSMCDMVDIAGTDFRDSIKAKRIFHHADVGMQKHLLNFDQEIFEK